MRNWVFLFVNLLSLQAMATIETSKTGIPLDKPWKKQLYEFAQKNAVHSVWGSAHSERDYQVAVQLGEQEKIPYDKDVLFAAAFLHDLGAIDPFAVDNVDHAVRSVEVGEPLMKKWGFPSEKWPKVRAAILTHMYYRQNEVSNEIESKLFHDADTLDFLGTIGIIRIVALTDHSAWANNLVGAIETLKAWTKELPATFKTKSAKKEAAKRINEMVKTLESLDPYTYKGAAL